MKDFLLRWVSLIVILLALAGYQITLDNREKDAEITALKQQAEQQTKEPETITSGYRDGIYEGVGEGFGGEIRIQLTVVSGRIDDVKVLSAPKEDSSYLSAAEGILSDILTAQSADVDTVSGATYSSAGIRQAAAQALRQAEN